MTTGLFSRFSSNFFSFFSAVSSPFLEKRCPACLAPYSGPAPLCPVCTPLFLPLSSGFCPLCGEIYPAPHFPVTPCLSCIPNPPPWQSFRFHSAHQHLMRHLILAAKFHGNPAVTRLLANTLATLCLPLFSLPQPPRLIIPMPLHPSRLRYRGFNQCLELTRPLARLARTPVAPHALSRVRLTRPQVGLPRTLRLTNLAHAFSALPLVRGLPVLLVDDTATTTASLRYATQALLSAGAAAVHVAVLARTPARAEKTGSAANKKTRQAPLALPGNIKKG